MEINSYYYNYYNVKGRYSPEKPEKSAWSKLYEDSEEIRSNNHNKDSDMYKALVKLENKYHDIGAANRSKYTTYEKLEAAIYNKYNSKEYSKYTKSERYTMYQNELSMSAFGVCTNISDPCIGAAITGETDAQVQTYNREAVNEQIKNIIKKSGIDSSIFNSKKITFEIEPYSYRLTVLGLEDSSTAQKLEQALNSGRNSKELFFHIIKSIGTGNIDTSILNKYRLASEIKNFTNLDLRSFKQTDKGFFNSKGENVLDIIKYAIKKSNNSQWVKSQAYDYIKKLADSFSGTDINSVPDLQLSIGYDGNSLIDMANAHILRSNFAAKA